MIFSFFQLLQAFLHSRYIILIICGVQPLVVLQGCLSMSGPPVLFVLCTYTQGRKCTHSHNESHAYAFTLFH